MSYELEPGDEWEPKREFKPHPSIACPECDDVSNECCELCRGTDQHCPVCYCPAEECEFQEGVGDDDD